MKESTKTSDGRPLGTPHLNKLEEGFSQRRYSFMKDFLPDFYDGKRVLDLGCGWGAGANKIISMGADSVIGIDINEYAIEEAKNNYNHDKIEYVHGDINEVSFDEKFDIIVAVEIVEHVTDKELSVLLNRCRDLLVDDGYIYVSTPRLRGKKEDFPKGSHWTEYEYDEYIGIMEDHGYKFIGGVKPEQTRDTAMAFIFQK